MPVWAHVYELSHLNITIRDTNTRTAIQPHEKPSQKQQNKQYPEIKGSCSYAQKEHERSKVGAKTASEI